MADLTKTFTALRSIMLPYASHLDCTSNTKDHFSMNTKHLRMNNKPLFFGAVQVRKRYVSYYLMPVYVNPGLLSSLSPELKKRMQGKSCFNFSSVDPPLLHELAALTDAGFRYYRSEGYI